MTPPLPSPKYKKSLLISYMDYEDDLKNNNTEGTNLQNSNDGESLM